MLPAPWLFGTAFFGLIFLGGQFYEFSTLFLDEHLSMHPALRNADTADGKIAPP